MIEPIDRKNGRTPSIQEVADKLNEVLLLIQALYEVSEIQQLTIDKLISMHGSGQSYEEAVKELKKKAN